MEPKGKCFKCNKIIQQFENNKEVNEGMCSYYKCKNFFCHKHCGMSIWGWGYYCSNECYKKQKNVLEI